MSWFVEGLKTIRRSAQSLVTDNKVTLCLTTGGRPDLLAQTLRSLLPYNGTFFDAAIVTNDRGDEGTNAIIREMLPGAKLLSHSTSIGEFRCVDEMCRMTNTRFVFHCEDDWLFDPVPFIPMMRSALLHLPQVSSVSARQSGSLRAHYGRERDWEEPIAIPGGGWVRRLSQSEQWRGLSFNPAMFRRSFWQEVGPFGQHTVERVINDMVEAAGYSRCFLIPGVYEHLGDGRHMTNPDDHGD